MDKILSKEEMNALLSSSAGTGRMGTSGRVLQGGEAENLTVYNFRHPDRFPKAALQSLQALHERFCTSAAASLSGFFRTLTEMTVVSAEQANFTEFLQQLPDPTLVTALSLRPLQGMAILEMGLDVAYPLIDRLLGGAGGTTHAERKMTEIEENVIRGVINLIAADLAEAWRPVTEISFHLHSTETHPQLLQAASPDEVVLVIAVELKIGENQGAIHLCLPYSALESVLEAFEQTGTEEPQSKDPRDLTRMLRWLLRAPVSVTCELPPTMVKVSELLSINKSDIMKLDSKVEERVRINVGEIPSFHASLMDVEGHKAAGVVGPIAE